MWLTKSSIGRKVVMSVSGLFLIFFLLFHGTMNLVAVFSKSGYDLITEFLGTNAVVQFMVPVLALGVIIHIVYACILTLQNRKARGNDRYDKTGRSDVQWAAKNMFVLGLIIVIGIALHLTHFWDKMQLKEWMGHEPANGFELIQYYFSNIWYVVMYL
ncbi:succinate dehydrogenase, partial [Porphyromonas sp. CAG:1061]